VRDLSDGLLDQRAISGGMRFALRASIMKNVFAISIVASLASLAVACAPQKPAASSPSSTDGVAASASKEAAPSVTASPELAAAVAKAKACELGEWGFDSSCEGFEAWDAEQPWFEEGKANPYLLSMLSGDDKSRLLAALKLRTTLGDEESAATVNRVLDAAANEKSDVIASAFGDLVAGLPLVETKTLARAIKIANAHPSDGFRSRFVLGAPHDAALVDLAVASSKSASDDVRSSSIVLLGHVAAFGPAKVCDALDALRSDSSTFVKNRATSELAESHQCAATHYDKLVADIGGIDLGKNAKSIGQDVGLALHAVCSDKATSPAQREKAGSIARKMSDAAGVSANTRYYTLSAVMGCDPKNGAAFVGKFKSNKDKTIADRAKTLTEKPKK
jgi:hypothetical protein